jgi:hypothetical protein
MENVVSINHTKENIIEFDISIEGIETKDISVRFIIDAKNMNIGFDAKKKKGDTWTVKIPAITVLEKTAYNFKIEVIADGYYFQPMDGVINVVGSAELYSTVPKNITIEPKNKKEDKKDKKTKVTKENTYIKKTKNREKSIEQLADEILNENTITKKPIIKEKEKSTIKENDKEEKIKNILEEFGFKHHKSSSSKRLLSFINKR